MKKKSYNKVGILLMFVVLFACQGNAGRKTADDSAQSPRQEQAVEPQFPFPSIPSTLTEPEERKEYLLQHYWDNFDFSDSALVNNRDVSEQGFVNQIALLADGITGPELIRQSMDNFCSGMEQNTHARKVFMQMAEDYLYDPNSPFYNEDLYLVYLKRMVQSKALDEAQKSTLAFKAELASRNRVGTEATDFVYYLPDGSKRSLKQTSVRGNRMILVFYDPECPSCHETLQQMMDDTALANAVDKGNVTVTAIYTEGNEDAWKKALPQMPENWIIGNDRMAVKDHALYDLKAMPSLYLLDARKQVLLKDVPYGRIKETLGL